MRLMLQWHVKIPRSYKLMTSDEGQPPTAQKTCASEKRIINIMLMTTTKGILWLRYSLILKGPEFRSRAFHVFYDFESLVVTKCTARLNTKISLFRPHSIFTERGYAKKMLEFERGRTKLYCQEESL